MHVFFLIKASGRNIELIVKLSYVYFTMFILLTRGVFYVRREIDLMKTAKVNAYIMHIFGQTELLSKHAT